MERRQAAETRERQLSRLPLSELYALLLDTVSKLESDADREEAARIVRAMIASSSRLRPSMEGMHPRVQQAVVSSFSEKLSKLQEALANLHMLLQTGSERAIRQAAARLGALVGAVAFLTEAPLAAPLGGFLAPVEATDVASELGGAAARVYGYILRAGRATSSVLFKWATASNLRREDVEEALRRLIERGYVRVEVAGGELEYVPA